MTNFLHDLTFGSPLWLWGWLALPLLAGLFVWAERRADRRLRQLIRAPRLRAQLTGAASTGRRRWRYALLLLGLGGLVTSLAEPRLGYEHQLVHRQGLDLIMLVDVSKSMLATDVLPNRLTRAKLAVQDAVRLLTGDRLGLVAFSGNAFLQAPLTIDYDAVLTASNELDTDLIPRGGTNIGAAIDLALEAFGKAEANNRAIILLSDGEPTSDDEQADGIKAAQAAAAAGVKIFTVGFGSTEGSLIPLGDKTGEFVREEDGTLVRSKLNESNLAELAKTTGGTYIPFTNGEATMRAVIQDGLGKLKTGEITAHENRKPIERYQWPLGAALLCLAASALIGERRKVRATAAGGSVSTGARAVPVPRRTPGGTAAPEIPAEVAGVAAAILLASVVFFPGKVLAADAAPTETVAPPALAVDNPTQKAIDLYNKGKYAEAYKAFKQLAEKDPKAGSLQFDAGTSAYKSKQYDEAIQAFGNSLASDDPALQAQSQYNFGNTLFRHGEEQKSRDTKIGDWKDAIKHYDDALNYLKTHKDDALTQNTIYNRDVVQKHLDEELKDKEKQDQKKDQKKDQKDQKQDKNKDQDQKGSKPDQQKGDQKQDDKSSGDQQKQDQQQESKPQEGQNQQGSSGSGAKNDSKDQQGQNDPSGGEGQNNPTPQPNGQGKPDEKNEQNPQAGQKSDGKQDPTPQPNKSKGDQGDQGSQPPGDSAQGEKPDAGDIPNQDKPRQRGDFQAQPGSKPQDQDKDKDKGGKEGDELAQAEPGKMTPGQARALLEALKGEDDRVNLSERNRRNRDQAVTKDW